MDKQTNDENNKKQVVAVARNGNLDGNRQLVTNSREPFLLCARVTLKFSRQRGIRLANSC